MDDPSPTERSLGATDPPGPDFPESHDDMRRPQSGSPEGGRADSGKPSDPARGVQSSEPKVSRSGRAPRNRGRRQFGRYDLMQELGRGGMGVVYRAHEPELDRVVAVKIVAPGHLDSEQHKERFLAEARAAARVQHPNVVRVYEAGDVDGQPYFVMECIDGISLAKRLQKGRMEFAKAAQLLATVARAVHHLHTVGIIHRDLKPSNILLDATGTPFVTDFGVARVQEESSDVTEDGRVAGTPNYMSPEQAKGSWRLGPSTDIFSLGVILYEILTGRLPFRDATPLETMMRVVEDEATPPHLVDRRVPRELSWVCMRCLEKLPQDRYPTAEAFAEDLDRFLRGEDLEARRPGPLQAMMSWGRRRPALTVRLIALGACAAVAHTDYLLVEQDSKIHYAILSILVLWMVSSAGFYRAIERMPGGNLARVGAVLAEVMFLTAILRIVDAPFTPMVVAYPLIIVASGLWFHEVLVWITTIASCAAYAFLLSDAARRGLPIPKPDHVAVFGATVLALGAAMAFLVSRVRTLTRYSRRRG